GRAPGPLPGATRGGGGRAWSATTTDPPHGRSRPVDDAVTVEQAVLAAARAFHAGDDAAYARHLADLAIGGITPRSRRLVALTEQVLERLLEAAIASAWVRGWQPADVDRVVRRRLSVRHVAPAAAAIARQHRRYAAATVDASWRAQLQGIGADPWAPAPAQDRAGDDASLPLDLGPEEQAGGADDVDAMHRELVEVLSVLSWLPELPRLGPLPGQARSGSARSGSANRAGPVDGRVLERVRALLAKAESTTFVEEAEAFTAKAQELMARHALDRAMVEGAGPGNGPGNGPGGRRIGTDDPYAQQKSLLLAQVASANRCQSVWSAELGFSTVFGHGTDLDGVELLYTSLLIQATTAMAAAGSHIDRYGRSRTRSFRSSFLAAYAQRIGERLRESVDIAEAAGAEEHGAGLLPVLAARDQAVEDAVGAAFPKMRQYSVPASNRAGWVAGTAAAQVARLSAYDEVQRQASA
nr:DUF2786 domain-containing protein [Actinomycetota bacterium]